jgi:group I intron endonuclease
MCGFIYLTTNKINNKKYVGMCKNTHRDNYLGSGKLLKQALKKYGRENFSRVILQECATFAEMGEAEIYWIKYYNAVEDPTFYNITSGGFGGNSDYMKAYWSELNKDERKLCRNWSRKNMIGSNNPMYGRKHTQDTKQLIGSKSVDRNWNKPNHFGANNPRAKKVLVETKNETKYFDCLKDYYNENQTVSYAALKGIAQKGIYSQKYEMKITYV